MATPTQNMINTPQQAYEQICTSCKVMQAALSETDNIYLGDARANCASCRKIYKFDAIYRHFKNNPFGGNRNIGKKSVISQNEKQAIIKLYQNGESIRKLSVIFGLGRNKNTILKIIHQQ